MTTTVVVNTHMHCKLAKANGPGFRESRRRFWIELAGLLRKYQAQIMLGDFNMSVFDVVPQMRSHGIIIDLVAIYPWSQTGQREPYSDSCAIWLLNGCSQISMTCGLGSFSSNASGSRGSGSAEDGSRGSRPPEHEEPLPEFDKGQGYALTSHMPFDRSEFETALRANFTRSTDLDPNLLQGDNIHRNGLHYPWKQKPAKTSMWDPDGNLFRTGAHMPLLGFLGKAGRRSEGALLNREIKSRERKGKGKRKGADQTSVVTEGTKGQGKGKGGRKGKTSQAQDASSSQEQRPPMPEQASPHSPEWPYSRRGADAHARTGQYYSQLTYFSGPVRWNEID